MISILCEKHKAEWTKNHLAVPRLPDEGWFRWSLRVTPVDNEDCSDCRIIGLSKTGEVMELSQPEDWMFS